MLDLGGKQLILASGSPRRAMLMKLMGLDFEAIESRINEDDESFSFPEIQVLELSQKKASRVAESIGDGLVVGVDTVVVLGSSILGKPRNRAEARKMLSQLSGQTHSVFTGFTIIEKPSYEMYSDYERTEVTFRELDRTEIQQYVETDEPMDKAGAYGIQDQSALFVSRIQGCFYNVVGLPVTKFYLALQKFLTRIELTS